MISATIYTIKAMEKTVPAMLANAKNTNTIINTLFFCLVSSYYVP